MIRRDSRDGPSLWIERIPVWLGFEQFCQRTTGRDGLGAYLFVLTAIGIDLAGGFAATVLYGTTPPILINPFWAVLPIALILAVWSARKMRNWYESLIRKIDHQKRAESFEATDFGALLPQRLRLFVYIVLLLLYAVTVLVTALDPILEQVGPVIGFIKHGILIPFVYLPVVIDWGAILLGIHLILPHHVRNAQFQLDFSDPLNFGGMYEFGALLKYSYYMYVGALVLFLIWRYGAALSGNLVQTPYPDPGILTTAQFAAAWLLGVGFLGHSLYIFHTHMADAKERKLEAMNQRIRELGGDPYSIPETDPDPELVDRVRFEYEQMQVVKKTRELPIGFSITSQIVFSMILPVLIERAFSILL